MGVVAPGEKNTIIVTGQLAAVSCKIIKVFVEQTNIKLHYCNLTLRLPD